MDVVNDPFLPPGDDAELREQARLDNTFEHRLANERDLGALAELYGDLARILQNIEKAMESQNFNARELDEAIRAAKARFCASPDYLSPDLVGPEPDRYRLVEATIQRLPQTIASAAAAGQTAFRLIPLDQDVAFRISWGKEACPKNRDHLHCPAYLRLWDYLEQNNLQPHFEQEIIDPGPGVGIRDYWLCAKLR